jgi:hypothetical protein
MYVLTIPAVYGVTNVPHREAEASLRTVKCSAPPETEMLLGELT